MSNQLILSLYAALGAAIDALDRDLRDAGALTLSSGSHEIRIDTEPNPKKIYTSLDADSPQGCGGSERSSLAVELHDDGFTIFAEIKSNSAVVSWLVAY